MKKDKNVKKIALASAIIALIVVMTAIPNVGFITVIPGVGFTLLHIPVLIGAFLLGKNYGALFGLLFGIGSWIMSFVYISTQAPFTNPIVSIVPRVVFAYFAGIIFDFTKKIFQGKKIYVPITFLVGTLLHTFMVLPLLYLIAKTGFFVRANEFPVENAFDYLMAIFTLNTLVEVGVAILIGSPIFYALEHLVQIEEVKE